MEPNGADRDGTQEEPVVEVPTTIPLQVPYREGGPLHLEAGPRLPRHPRPQVLAALRDGQVERLGVGGVTPPEQQAAAEIDPLLRDHQA